MVDYNSIYFESSFGLIEQLDECVGPEFVFAGRSNVGKSSLLNKLFGRKMLARVSSMPGKTTTINFYRSKALRFVDLPGYGYAKASKAERRRLEILIDGYFSQSHRISLVFLLIDMRHAASADDMSMINALIDSQLPFVVVMTKSDKLSAAQRKIRLENFSEQLPCFEQITFVPFSSKTGEGVMQLREIIDDIIC